MRIVDVDQIGQTA